MGFYSGRGSYFGFKGIKNFGAKEKEAAEVFYIFTPAKTFPQKIGYNMAKFGYGGLVGAAAWAGGDLLVDAASNQIKDYGYYAGNALSGFWGVGLTAFYIAMHGKALTENLAVISGRVSSRFSPKLSGPQYSLHMSRTGALEWMMVSPSLTISQGFVNGVLAHLGWLNLPDNAPPSWFISWNEGTKSYEPLGLASVIQSAVLGPEGFWMKNFFAVTQMHTSNPIFTGGIVSFPARAVKVGYEYLFGKGLGKEAESKIFNILYKIEAAESLGTGKIRNFLVNENTGWLGRLFYNGLKRSDSLLGIGAVLGLTGGTVDAWSKSVHSYLTGAS